MVDHKELTPIEELVQIAESCLMSANQIKGIDDNMPYSDLSTNEIIKRRMMSEQIIAMYDKLRRANKILDLVNYLEQCRDF